MLLYSLILLLRNLFYDKGWLKSYHPQVKSVCVGNLSLGGTGKTPMTELIIRTLQEDSEPGAEPVIRKEDMEYDGLFAGVGLFDGTFGGMTSPRRKLKNRKISVLSRGYKRKTKGFLIVDPNGTASQFGDEPLQIKRKFPTVTVAVDANRVEGAKLLQEKGCDYIILDDAFQHRRIKADKSILLTTFAHPFFKDHLVPLGQLRDLRRRSRTADMIVVTKCPTMLEEIDKEQWARQTGLRDFNPNTCKGVNPAGKEQYLLFSTVLYDRLLPVFPEGDPRYIHASLGILFTGIANDTPLWNWLSDRYKILEHFKFSDHHFYTKSDIASIVSFSRRNATAVVITTEKDAQRMREESSVPDDLKKKLFYAPIRTMMMSAAEQEILKNFLQ